MTALACTLALLACQKNGSEVSTGEKSSTITPSTPSTPSTPATKTEQPSPTQRLKPPEMFAGAHILVAYKGAMRSTAQRSKDEALKIAKELAVKARKDPANFAEMAKKHSDGPSGPRGGDLGSWPKGQMVPEFDKAIQQLKVGEISDPVETAFGYHVMIRRDPPPLFSGAHILVAYAGAMRAKPGITRTKEEALKLARELAEKAKKNPSSFAELAKQHSDGPSGPRGGDLGRWPKGRMVPQFDQAIEKLKIGEVSDPVETPFGFHVMMRKDPLVRD